MLLSVIILAKTDSNLSFNTTSNCIETLKKSEDFTDNFKLEIIIIESNKKYNDTFKFPQDVKVIVPYETFGFHKFLNIGIKASKGKFIALCNNDLLFHKNWFSSRLQNVKAVKSYRFFCNYSSRNTNQNTTDNGFWYRILASTSSKT